MKKITALLFLAVSGWSCFKNDPIDVPAYIYVPAVNVQVVDPATQGSASSQINDAWVSVDGQLVGANALPVLLPSFFNDSLSSNKVRIGAGIYDNGASNVRLIYPFYTRYEEYRDLEPGQIDTIYPVFEYDPNATVILVEDFEGPGTNFGYDIDDIDTTIFAKTQESVFEGNYSGILVFDSVESMSQVATSVQYSGLQSASTSFPVYVEIDCKTNLRLDVGLVAFNGNIQTEVSYFVGVNPGSEWKKIYFNFTTKIFEIAAQEYALTFRAFKNDTVPEPKVFIDNIKILHY